MTVLVYQICSPIKNSKFDDLLLKYMYMELVSLRPLAIADGMCPKLTSKLATMLHYFTAMKAFNSALALVGIQFWWYNVPCGQ